MGIGLAHTVRGFKRPAPVVILQGGQGLRLCGTGCLGFRVKGRYYENENSYAGKSPHISII
jgi:hypothetical protein